MLYLKWEGMMARACYALRAGGDYEAFKACFKAPFDEDEEVLRSTYKWLTEEPERVDNYLLQRALAQRARACV